MDISNAIWYCFDVPRVRCKPGLMIVGAENSPTDSWIITTDVQAGDRKSAVTAKRRPHFYRRDRSVERLS